MHQYQPTIIETRSLPARLLIQIAFLRDELGRSWIEFKNSPAMFSRTMSRDIAHRLRTFLSTPNVIPATLTAVAAITCVMLVVVLFDKTAARSPDLAANPGDEELVFVDTSKPLDSTNKPSTGKDGPGRVGFQDKKGEGSGPSRKLAKGGGGGGNHNPNPAQTGKLPPPSTILAAIPTRPPLNPPALPVAGIDIDPALWKDLKAPVYGDPRSKSDIESKGPGDGEGIGDGQGTGVGKGRGPGVGPGEKGNMGGGPKEPGCCGPGGGSDRDGNEQPLAGSQVEQRARVLSKPEPTYTEDARRNQVTGTVMLRVVFASNGDVVQIHAVHSLPHGLTERAIAAARQIKFVPAVKGGRPVSVFMQLEYNFNLY
ncbi:MAG TPA: energy transducer TonB [Pyrinomonadaceae bacterium]|nr:energy transducer TonB [Pyrinomonadaceae bacterium]